MAKVLEDMNRELVLELYEMKKLLKLAEEKLLKQKTENSENANLQTELDKLKQHASLQENQINKLTLTCHKLQAENNLLKQQNEHIATQYQSNLMQSMEMQKLYQTLSGLNNAKQSQFQVQNQQVEPQKPATVGKDPAAEYNHVDQQQTKKDKLAALASKLKLKQAQQGSTEDWTLSNGARGASPAPAPVAYSPKQIKAKPRAPTTALNSIENGSTGSDAPKSRSLMISGLGKEVSESDLVQYFSKYGKVTNYTDPLSNYKRNDGHRFVFLKFTNYDAVEKAVASGKHFIKGHLVTLKKGNDF